MNQSVLLLGCNMGDRMHYLNLAIKALKIEVGNIINESSVYESEPWGFDCETPFLNQILIIETEITAEYLLEKIQDIEKKLGRIRTKKGYEARTIDIDILFYDDIILATNSLKIPHPAIPNRRFTLLPLYEVLPEKIHPVLEKTVKELLIDCNDKLWVKKYS